MRELLRYPAKTTCTTCIAAFVLFLVAAQAAFAQGTPAPPTQVVARPMYLEWGITIAMIGLALFAVCRKSNRS